MQNYFKLVSELLCISVAGVYQYAVNLELLDDPDTEDISNLLAQVRIYSCMH